LARGKDYSEETASFIDREVRRLLDASHTKVFDLLSSKKDKLNSLAQALLDRETIGKEELIKILGARPGSQILQKVTEAET